MNDTCIRTPRGLYTHPSKIAVPEGALVQATNCYVYREGVISKRRGMERDGDEFDDAPQQLMLYRNQVLAYDGSTLFSRDNSSVYTAYTGTFSQPGSGLRLPWTEQNLNFYFGTSNGVYTIDAIDATPVRAGTPPGLDLTATRVGIGDGFMPPDTNLAYRVTFTHEDANRNVKEGYPSFPEVCSNPVLTSLAWTRSGTTITVTLTAHGYSNSDTLIVSESTDETAAPNGPVTINVIDANTFSYPGFNTGDSSGTLSVGKAANVSLTFTLPQDLVAGDRFHLYRTVLTASADDPAGDDMAEIAAGDILSSDLSTGTITFLDTLDDAFRGVNLYSSPNQEGPSQANSRPPWCELIVAFKGHTFYGVFRGEEALQIQLLAASTLSSGTSTIKLTLGGTITYTFGASENPATRTVKISTTLDTEAENIRETAKSLVRVINRDPSNTKFYAFYNSTETDPPGKILLQTRAVNTGNFSVSCNNATATGQYFNPALPTASGVLNSDSSYLANGLRRSKFQQPEAVPALNTHKIGAANKKLLGAVALKDVVLIFTESGVYTLSGNTDGAGGFQFTVDELDPTIIMNARNSLVTLDSAAFCTTQQGVVRVTQAGASIVSRQIEDDLRRTYHFFDYTDIAHAVSYESEHLYLLFAQKDTSDTEAKVAWAFNTVTESWTQYILKPISSGIVNPSEDVLYLTHAEDPFVLRERKTLLRTGADFVDESIPGVVTALGTTTDVRGNLVSTVTVSFTYSQEPKEGWLFEQGNFTAVATAVNKVAVGQFILTLSKYKPTIAIDDCALGIPVNMTVRWAPVDLGDQGSMKQFPFMMVTVEGAGGHHRLGMLSDLNSGPALLNTIILPGGHGWGEFGWGTEPWGSPGAGGTSDLRTFVHKNHQMARAFIGIYGSEYARESANVLALTLTHNTIGLRPERRPR